MASKPLSKLTLLFLPTRAPPTTQPGPAAVASKCHVPGSIVFVAYALSSNARRWPWARPVTEPPYREPHLRSLATLF